MITKDVENTLEAYTLEEVLELNDLTDYDVLLYLVEWGVVKLPNPRPIDLHDEEETSK